MTMMTMMTMIVIMVTIFVLSKMWVSEGGDAIMAGGKSEMASMHNLSRNVTDLNLHLSVAKLNLIYHVFCPHLIIIDWMGPIF